MHKNSKIYVAGHRGLVGSAIVRRLKNEGYTNLLLRTSAELDLRKQAEVAAFFEQERPEYVFLAAAKVGGIVANDSYPAEFIYDNLMIQGNVIHQAYLSVAKRLLFLGSSCIYPRLAPQPMREEYLLGGLLEPTNDAYAVAKIAGIIMCRSYNRQYGTRFLSVMPTNLYGPGDNFDLEKSHVLPALMRKFHEATMGTRDGGTGNRNNESQASIDQPPVTIWGTGAPMREFLHVDDLSDACLYLMNQPEEVYSSLLAHHLSPALINVGSGEEVSIRELALLVQEVVGHRGELLFDTDKPDGTPRKLCDVEKIRSLGWKHRIGLREGVQSTFAWYQSRYNDN
ncbi:MAG: GDP-L-fucose synthase [Desulfuromonadales bacterium]|nr:GDP-L-fucose synthase [Desulfuromonadales bacterium]